MPRNNYILIVFDSCRYDAFQRARPKTSRKLGTVEKRWAYASWTGPSHFNLLTGLMPHSSPKGVFASDYYQRDFLKYNERLGATGIEFKRFVPRLYLPVFLQSLGYRTPGEVYRQENLSKPQFPRPDGYVDNLASKLPTYPQAQPQQQPFLN